MTLRSTLNFQSYGTSDAAFRNWCSIWHGNFSAAMVQTADTGQINIATVLAPTGVNQVRGYEIYRYNDAWQATSPIFVKVEYGSSNHTAWQVYNMWISVGTGTDGAGNLTISAWPTATAVITRRSMNQGGNGTATVIGNIYFTYLPDGSWACLAFPVPGAPDTQTGTFFYSVERWRNGDGTANGEGLTVLNAYAGYNNSATTESRWYSTGFTQPTAATSNWQTVNSIGGTTAVTIAGTTIYPLPVFTGLAPRIAAPSQLVLVGGAYEYPINTPLTVGHYGASHQFLFAGGGPGYPVTSGKYQNFYMRAD